MAHLPVSQRVWWAALYSGLIDDDKWAYEGRYANATCPVCEQRNYMFWNGEGHSFYWGCRDKCDRMEILHAIGLDGYDMCPVQPRWLRKV